MSGIGWRAATVAWALGWLSLGGTARGDELTVATFNIRYANPGDGANAWPHRQQAVADVLTRHGVDVAGLQEALLTQLQDLDRLLPGYARFGVGRDDGQQRGEYSPVLYRRDRWRLVEGNTRWLSPEPDRPGSKGWDAAITRIATRCVLEPVAGGARFVVFNTHFDHLGETARLESARLLTKWLRSETLPCILLGDFNCTPAAPPYQELTTAQGTWQLFDSRLIAQQPPQGPDATWNGFEAVVAGQRIDFVFVDRPWRVVSHLADDARIAGTSRFPSDHLPVIVGLSRSGK